MEAGLWFYEYEGRKIGPIPLETLRHLAAYGAIYRKTRVWQGDTSEPIDAQAVDGVFEPAQCSAAVDWEVPTIECLSVDPGDDIGISLELPSHYAIQFADNVVFTESDLDGDYSPIHSQESFPGTAAGWQEGGDDY